ncbi:MAG: rubredoxin-like domain-containing protein [Promethearchaeota archaeon]
MAKWKCTVCGYIHTGDEPPAKCPICGVGPEKFVKIE